MKKRVTLWSILILALVAGGAYSQGTLIKRLIGSQDVQWAIGGSGAREVFTYTTPQGYVLTLNKPDATDLRYRSVGAGSVEGSATADKVPPAQTYASLSALVTSLGTSTPATLKLLPGTYPVNSSLIVPANIKIKPEPGAILNANNATLTIQGPIEAGPYQIFSWTGTGAIDLTASPTKRCYLQWWGATPGTTTSGADISPALLMAYQSLTSSNSGSVAQHQDIVVTNGIWWLNSNMTYSPTSGFGGSPWPPNLVGEDEAGSVIVTNVGASTDGICIGGVSGGNTMWPQGCWIKNLTVLGATGSCRHAFNLQCWNSRGGTENLNIVCGSASSAIFLSSVENCTWDVKFGPVANKYGFDYSANYAGIECAPVAGVGYVEGGGTYNKFSVHKTFLSGGLFAIKLNDAGDSIVDAYDLETGSGAEVQSNYIMGLGTNPVNLYSGGITKIGQTFTLSSSTEIDNVGFTNAYPTGSPSGVVTGSIYATSGGVPTGSPIYTSWKTYNMGELSGNNHTFFSMAKQTLAAGTYFVSEEFSGGDASNYITIYTNTTPVQGNPSSVCFAWNGSSWAPQTYNIGHYVNARGAIWITGGSGVVHCHHLEANFRDIVLDAANSWDVYNGSGNIEITRSYNVNLFGASGYSRIITDPYSSVRMPSNYAIPEFDAMQDAGTSIYDGNLTTWTAGISTPVNIKGNSNQNLMPNTLLDRWQTSMPDGGWAKGSTTMVQAGTGKSDTTRNPLTPYCAKITYASTGQTNWNFGQLTGELLNMCKGRWMCWSWLQMFPSGQTFATSQYMAPNLSVPSWQANTQYNMGDAVNGGAAICVEPGISGSGSEPTWGSAAPTSYNVDGTVVWLNCYPWSPGQFNNSVSDGIWRRVCFVEYVPTNATSAGFLWQWYGQTPSGTTTAYFALPMINFGRMPGMAPAPIGLLPVTGTQVVGANHIDFDGLIPTNSSSKIYGLWSSQGDIVYSTGAAHSGTAGWICVTAGINGSGSAWYTFAGIN